MTVSAKVRARLPASRLGKPGSDGYPMPDKKHARIAKGFAAMHHDPDKAAIDAKANAILAKKRGGLVVDGKGKKPHLGRPGRQHGGDIQKLDPRLPREEWEPSRPKERVSPGVFPRGTEAGEEWQPQQSPGIQSNVPAQMQKGPDIIEPEEADTRTSNLKRGGAASRKGK